MGQRHSRKLCTRRTPHRTNSPSAEQNRRFLWAASALRGTEGAGTRGFPSRPIRKLIATATCRFKETRVCVVFFHVSVLSEGNSIRIKCSHSPAQCIVLPGGIPFPCHSCLLASSLDLSLSDIHLHPTWSQGNFEMLVTAKWATGFSYLTSPRPERLLIMVMI